MPDSARIERKIPRAIVATAVLILIAAAAGVAATFAYVREERARDLRAWQDRLTLIADTRAAAVEDWFAQQNAALKALADNLSVQLYLTELAAAGGNRSGVTDEPAQATFLRNLLLVTAERTGFNAPAIGARVDANVPRVGVAGLAMLAADGRPLVQTPDMPAIAGRLAERVALAALRGEASVEDIHAGPGGTASMAFIAPVFAIQGDPGSGHVGLILGVKEVERELYPLLTRPPLAEKTAESLLLRKAGATIEYLSPLADGSRTLQKRIDAKTPDLTEARAIDSPGSFGLGRDYRDREVLAIGRAIQAMPWTLVQKVDRSEALADSDARLGRLLAALLLIVGLVTAALAAIWRHGASRRASEAAEKFENLARRFEDQSKLLRLVTDSQPAAIFIADPQSRIGFANQALGLRVGGDSAELVGKTLSGVFGPAEARRYEGVNRLVLASGESRSDLYRDGQGGTERVLQTQFVPLRNGAAEPKGVLVVEHDVTTAVVERERRERTLKELVRALTSILDRHDPHAANHSARVALVARRIAEEMGLDSVQADTAETVGNLVNIGKIMVPPELLSRPGPLSDEERKRVRDAMEAGADLVARIEFEGPVAETLRQIHERWDGSGRPLGRKGEEILVTARIVAVANSFVALLSSRSWRAGMSFDQAIETLLRESGSVYDRRVVAALVNDLENRGGRERWASFAAPAA